MSDYPQWSDGGGGHGHHHNHHQQQNHHQQPNKPPQSTGASWLLPDYAGSAYTRGQQHDWTYPPVPPPTQAGMGGYGYGNGYPPPNHRPPPPRGGAASEVSFDTSAKDPESVRARIFIGSLASGQGVVTREDVIELCLPYGALRGVTFFKKQGYAFVQFESAGDADAACRELNGVRWKGCHMDAHPVDSPSRLPHPSTMGDNKLPAPPVPPSKTVMKAVPTTNYDEISYDTSSKEPSLLRARVFIGSLNRSPVVRNDVIELCAPYGKITAVTLFKGYAFVQFESPVDAVDACEKLSGKTWKGNKIDVHLAMEGSTRKRNTTEEWAESPSPASSNTMDWSGSAAKRAREEEVPKGDFELLCKTCRFVCSDVTEFVQHREGGGCEELKRTGEPPVLGCSSCEAVLPNAWRMLFHLMDDHHHRLKLVTVDASQNGLEKAREEDKKKNDEWWKGVERWLEGQAKQEDGEVEEDVEDKNNVPTGVTIVCGQCKLVTDDWSVYKEHKKRDCIKKRDQLEPSCIICSMCQESFTSAWKALFHLMDHHRMKLFYPDYTKEAQARSIDQMAKDKSSVEKRMKMWIESQSL